MTAELRKQAIKTDLAELKRLFGPPPVLSSENVDLYYEIMTRLMESLGPRDFLEQILIKEVANATWDIIRIGRHKTLAIERKFRQRIEYQARKTEEVQQRKEALRRILAEKGGRPATEAERTLELLDVVESSVTDVDKILRRTPEELDHARGLEDSIDYYERLVGLLNEAIAQRNDALDQLEHYRDSLGQNVRRASDQIIEAEFSVTEQPGQTEEIEAPLVPADGETS